ncbi:MAG: hypothetical protein IKC63_00485 [Clostridia bacterium]|nr:hypothetical protein [Clostridia bacterium]
MKRSAAYYRSMREKHIKRKKRITAHYPGCQKTPYYRFDGMFDKGKIHCSCPLCTEKATRRGHVPTVQEKRRLGKTRRLRFRGLFEEEENT